LNRESNGTSGLNLGAVGVGMIWGLGLMILSVLVQALVSSMAPLSASTIDLLSLAYRGLGALVGGYMAARRAASVGWLHGAAAGVALVLSIFAVMGVGVALPTLADFLKMTGVGTVLGTLGGVVGVNAGNR